MKKRDIGLPLILILACLIQPALAQLPDFHWRGFVDKGQAVEIKGVNGKIEARAGNAGDVEVIAEKTADRSNPEDVEIQVVPHAGGVTICAVYPDSDGQSNECLPGSNGRTNVRDNDVKVHFTVYLPAGVDFVGRNVNGDVWAEGLSGDVVALTVNGNIEARSKGLVRAKTVNGSIRAAMTATQWDEKLEFNTVNGSITVEMPSGVDADVEASSVNGSIRNDFGLEVTGRWGPKKLRGTIGRGGQQLALKTVNGTIELLNSR